MRADIEKTMDVVGTSRDQLRKRFRAYAGLSVCEEEPPRKRTVYRKASLQWTLCGDNILRWFSFAKDGWKTFYLSPDMEKTEKPERWPLLRIVVDQGPDGVCAAHFLLYVKHGLLEFWWDFLHGVDADVWLALAGVGLAAHMRLMITVWSLAYAPWNHGERFHQASEAIAEMTALPEHEAADDVFRSRIMDIADDKGMVENSSDPDFREVVGQIPNEVRTLCFL